MPELEHHYIETNGIRLHVVQAGPKSGPLVILLTLFPPLGCLHDRKED